MAEASRRFMEPVHAPGARFLIVEACFYDAIGAMQLAGAKTAIADAGASCEVISVPGALEIPTAIAMTLARVGKPFDGFIALGCIIRGETYHFEIVANESARALMDLAVQHKLVLGNGILTVENEAQALVRADPKQSDKGGDAARAALALYHIQKQGR